MESNERNKKIKSINKKSINSNFGTIKVDEKPCKSIQEIKECLIDERLKTLEAKTMMLETGYNKIWNETKETQKALIQTMQKMNNMMTGQIRLLDTMEIIRKIATKRTRK
jgi:RNase H-fold protein (predicted Holliday junction resolvase)